MIIAILGLMIISLQDNWMRHPSRVLAQTGGCVSPPSGMVAWWPGDGNADDIQGPTFENGALNDTGFAMGRVDQAFDINQQGVTIADNAVFSQQAFTIEGWITAQPYDCFGCGQFIASKSGSTSFFGYELGTNRENLTGFAGGLRFTINGGMSGDSDLLDEVSIADGLFHHVAATYDGATMKLYLDGALAAQKSVTTTITYEADSPFIIGQRQGTPSATLPYNGLVDELSFYNRALSDAEIAAIFNADSAGKCKPGSCAISCPEDIVVSNAQGQCGAVVSYDAPTTSGDCGMVSCSPASGTFFSIGTTTVTCSTTAGPNCSFTVTVVDNTPPTITCPGNVVAAASSSGQTSAAVTFPNPSASDNCSGVSTICTPESGSTFPKGTTTVTCKATDASGNMATCAFTVTVFDVCLQDETQRKNVLLFNSSTGDYIFCCGSTIMQGRGTVTLQGGDMTLQHSTGDRRVLGKVSLSMKKGIASLQSPPGSTKCTITDKDITNNNCACQSPM
jgi:hypothetical protein